jgi:hypothetical protein
MRVVTSPYYKLPDGKQTRIVKFEPENWKEYFRVEISNAYEQMPNRVIPKGFIKTSLKDWSGTWFYWKWYLAPIAKLLRKIKDLWFYLGSLLAYKGYLKHIEGEQIPWLWPLRIIFKKIKN